MKTNRKFRHSKLIGTKEVAGVLYSYYITEDLEDDELQQHIAHALETEDYEYAEAVVAEAKRRGLNVQLILKNL